MAKEVVIPARKIATMDEELKVMGHIARILKRLPTEAARERVIAYLSARYSVEPNTETPASLFEGNVGA